MKNKDIVFIIAVKKDGQLKPEYEIGIESWRRWCKKNDVELFLLEDPVLPMDDMHIIWQRYFLFDIYDANEIEANQTLMVDADTIIHPDCPNFFNETDNKYCMIHDDGSYDCVLRGMEHYSKYVYDESWFNYWEYGNSGFQIVNDKHRDFFQHMRDFYFENIENITITLLKQLETLRSSVLKQAFEGKLVPQNPDDEPASVLLEKIKSTKECQNTKQRGKKNVK